MRSPFCKTVKRMVFLLTQQNSFLYKDGILELRKRNLSFLNLVDRSLTTDDEYQFPELSCDIHMLPDYIAMSSQPHLFHNTSRTAVGFWEYDRRFNNPRGLTAALYWDDKKQLERYKQRFSGVKYIFTPDYSVVEDMPACLEYSYVYFSRIVALWLMTEVGTTVIPTVSASTIERLAVALLGLDNCNVIAISTKGYLRNSTEKGYLREMVRYVVDHKQLDSIVVYDTCSSEDEVYDIFEYALEHNINIDVPLNSYRELHMKERG